MIDFAVRKNYKGKTSINKALNERVFHFEIISSDT